MPACPGIAAGPATTAGPPPAGKMRAVVTPLGTIGVDSRHAINRLCRRIRLPFRNLSNLTQNAMTPTQCQGRSFTGMCKQPRGPRRLDLQGIDVNSIRLVDITRKGLDDYSLRNLSNGEFQGVVFVRSASEAVFTTNLLRLLRQDKVDLDKVAAHLHGAAPPDKHKESSRFMEPLLSELLQTFKKISPPESPPEDNEELARAKRKLKAAGIELSPPVKRRTSELNEPSSSARKSEHPLPVEQSPAEVILNKAVEQKPASYPSANTKAAMDTWLKSHQSQFRGQTLKFKNTSHK